MEEHMSNIEATVETITAEKAALYLAGNSHNRHVNAARVKTYAQQMSEGRWELTGASVQFSTDGRLLDGQHRLMAVQRVCETTPAFSIPMLVVRGVSVQAFQVIDTGKVRSLADALHIEGHININRLSAAIFTHYQIVTDDWSAQAGDNGRMMAHLKEHPMIEAAVQFKQALDLLPRQTIMMAVFAVALEQGVPLDTLLTFAQSFRTGESLAVGSPVLALRSWAINQRLRATPAAKQDIAEQYAYILGAYLRGRRVKLLKIAARVDPFNFMVRAKAV